MNINTSNAVTLAKISYNVTFPEVQAHYVDIEMNIEHLNQSTLVLKMPVWTPGSYLVREFAKSVESFTVSTNGKEIPFVKTRKNWWSINTKGLNHVTIKYKVYCFEVSVRTAFVDISHAFLSTSGIFMYPEGMLNQPSTIHIVPFGGWDKVSTSLDMVNNDPFTVHAPNYDILFDSPIEVGNQDVFGFDAAGVHYQFAMYGGGNYDKEKLKVDVAKIVEQETAVYGENPNKHYVFIVHNYFRGGGGLEHLSSTVLGASRDAYGTPRGYQNFLSLVAHEHFHLWNVKRLRPIALGPFDYDNENYTTDLWIAEGFTAYYEDIILRHAKLIDADNYLGVMANDINQVENTPGKKIQSIADASYDAWIKAYRPTENSNNSTISYYSKGSVAAMLLDLEIINDSQTKYSLDDVMKYMYHEYYKNLKRGYTDAEFKKGLEKFSGKNLDDFYKKYVYGVADVDYNKYLGYAGYQLTDEAAGNNDPSLGIMTATIGGKIVVTNVLRDGTAWVDGINVNDEIVSVDGTPVTDVNGILANKKVGDKLSITVNRDGLSLVLPVTLLKNSLVKYKIETVATPSAQQLKVRSKWLKL
ncbi:M61 family metallopeptidase [Mucilaginibacter sp. E4BP6]|uniref:M61 family metallopeptidase n=1 Tax=Mucilaginibacter sp. E4BP6 TaxID=2723089 RepID=UPI00180C483F|nr:PDZ domain-containing protein [Mucilaginibacter sp. E4BP6]NYE66802.1 putative metalloprotease with PDZ domain [Mucilaginibacter sp. E4BP6]